MTNVLSFIGGFGFGILFNLSDFPNVFKEPCKKHYVKKGTIFDQIILEGEAYKAIEFDKNNRIVPALDLHCSLDKYSETYGVFCTHEYETFGPVFKSMVSKEEFIEKYKFRKD